MNKAIYLILAAVAFLEGTRGAEPTAKSEYCVDELKTFKTLDKAENDLSFERLNELFSQKQGSVSPLLKYCENQGSQKWTICVTAGKSLEECYNKTQNLGVIQVCKEKCLKFATRCEKQIGKLKQYFVQISPDNLNKKLYDYFSDEWDSEGDFCAKKPACKEALEEVQKCFTNKKVVDPTGLIRRLADDLSSNPTAETVRTAKKEINEVLAAEGKKVKTVEQKKTLEKSPEVKVVDVVGPLIPNASAAVSDDFVLFKEQCADPIENYAKFYDSEDDIKTMYKEIVNCNGGCNSNIKDLKECFDTKVKGLSPPEENTSPKLIDKKDYAKFIKLEKNTSLEKYDKPKKIIVSEEFRKKQAILSASLSSGDNSAEVSATPKAGPEPGDSTPNFLQGSAFPEGAPLAVLHSDHSTALLESPILSPNNGETLNPTTKDVMAARNSIVSAPLKKVVTLVPKDAQKAWRGPPNEMPPPLPSNESSQQKKGNERMSGQAEFPPQERVEEDKAARGMKWKRPLGGVLVTLGILIAAFVVALVVLANGCCCGTEASPA